MIKKQRLKRYSKSLDTLMTGLNQERVETKEMVRTFFDALTHKLPNGRKPDEREIKAAIEQLKDVHKIAGLLVVAMTPGSVITLPALCAFGRKFGIEFLPSSFQNKNTADQIALRKTAVVAKNKKSVN